LGTISSIDPWPGRPDVKGASPEAGHFALARSMAVGPDLATRSCAWVPWWGKPGETRKNGRCFVVFVEKKLEALRNRMWMDVEPF